MKLFRDPKSQNPNPKTLQALLGGTLRFARGEGNTCKGLLPGQNRDLPGIGCFPLFLLAKRVQAPKALGNSCTIPGVVEVHIIRAGLCIVSFGSLQGSNIPIKISTLGRPNVTLTTIKHYLRTCCAILVYAGSGGCNTEVGGDLLLQPHYYCPSNLSIGLRTPNLLESKRSFLNSLAHQAHRVNTGCTLPRAIGCLHTYNMSGYYNCNFCK